MPINVVNEGNWEGLRLFLRDFTSLIAEECDKLVTLCDPVHHGLDLGQNVHADGLGDVWSERN